METEEKRKNYFNNSELSYQMENEIRETFDILKNKEKPEILELDNLKIAMMSLGLSPSIYELGRIELQLKLFKKVDRDSSIKYNQLTFDDFHEIVYPRLLNKKGNEYNKMFELISDGKEEITTRDIEKLSNHFYEGLKEDEINKISSSSDIDLDGKITYDDFKNILQDTNYI